MAVVIYITALIIAAVLIAVVALLIQSRREAPFTPVIPRMEAAEELTPRESRDVSPELPDSYNDTRLVLMVRDPEWLFAYWDIGESHWRDLTRRYGEKNVSREHLTLRVFEMSDQMGYFDIQVGALARDWHIPAGKRQTPFYCQLGIKNHRDFIILAVSNTAVTPRDGLSPVYDEEWMLVNDHEQRLLKRLGEFPPSVTSPFK